MMGTRTTRKSGCKIKKVKDILKSRSSGSENVGAEGSVSHGFHFIFP
jgi:hypothetical protein